MRRRQGKILGAKRKGEIKYEYVCIIKDRRKQTWAKKGRHKERTKQNYTENTKRKKPGRERERAQLPGTQVLEKLCVTQRKEP